MYFNTITEAEYNSRMKSVKGACNYHFYEYVAELVNAMPENRKAQRERKAECIRLLEGAYTCSANCGQAYETLNALIRSEKRHSSRQNRVDLYLRLPDGSLVPVEVKTNGGRVQSLLDGTNKAKYVLFTLWFKNKTGLRELAPRLIPTEEFVAYLKSNPKATKYTNSTRTPNELAIQPSCKALYNWAATYPEYTPYFID